MIISEFVSNLPLFVATVRAKTASSAWVLKTAIHAEGIAQARQLLTAIGQGNCRQPAGPFAANFGDVKLTIENSERMFHLDSESCLKLFKRS